MLDRLRESLRAFIMQQLSELPFLRIYTGTIVVQHSDKTVDVRSDDNRIPNECGLVLWLGLPGATCTVPNGTRCLVAYANGSSQQPFAMLFPSGSDVTEINLGSAAGAVIREGDTISIAAVPPVAGIVSITLGTAEVPPATSKVKA